MLLQSNVLVPVVFSFYMCFLFYFSLVAIAKSNSPRTLATHKPNWLLQIVKQGLAFAFTRVIMLSPRECFLVDRIKSKLFSIFIVLQWLARIQVKINPTLCATLSKEL